MVATNLPKVLLIAASTFVLAYALTWAARWLAPQLGFIDKPDGGRKNHRKATPLLGGVAIYLAFAIGMTAIFLGTNVWSQSPTHSTFSLALLISGALFCGLGLWDDWSPIRARYKFILQIAATIPFIVLGPSIESLQCLGVRLELGMMAVPFTIFWIVSCANILNLIDGMDGLASSVGLIASATLATLFLSLNHLALATVGFVFVACLCGFLLHNWPPAKIFLGDSGSLTIGFVVGALSAGGALKTATGFVLIFPIVLLGIPILDTALAIFRRKLMGQSIGDADYGHIHHRLQQRGLSKLQALLVIIGLCSAMAIAVIVAGRMRSEWFALAFGGAVLLAMVVGRVFGFHEFNLAIRSLRIVHRVFLIAVDGLRARMSFLRFETIGSQDSGALWKLMESCAEGVGGTRVELTIENDENLTVNTVAHWERKEPVNKRGIVWDVRYSVPREEGLRVTLVATGSYVENEREQELEHLIQLSSQVCRSWPLEGPAVLSIEDHFHHAIDEENAWQDLASGQRAA
jgi:UDP-GlcNAc:undecaprenyl-phosphate GlcNAc-1-phosphate transferase